VTLQFMGFVTDYEITPAYLERGSSDEDRVVLIPASGGGSGAEALRTGDDHDRCFGSPSNRVRSSSSGAQW
jgi:hypothetical protein